MKENKKKLYFDEIAITNKGDDTVFVGNDGKKIEPGQMVKVHGNLRYGSVKEVKK